MISPIGSDGSPERRHADMVMGVAVEPLFRARGYAVERADLHADPGQITTGIFAALRDAYVCVADLSFLNANVMYELGVRHTLMRPVIQVARLGTALPFDTANQRTLFFDPSDFHSLEKLKDRIGAQLDRIEADPTNVSNPMTHAIGSIDLSLRGDDTSLILADLQERLERVERIERRSVPQIGSSAHVLAEISRESRMADFRREWRRDLAAAALDWTIDDDGGHHTHYRGFDLSVRPQRGNRWSAAATERGSGYSVPWPSWQPTDLDAKAGIVALVDLTLAEREAAG